jgi:ABC-type Fe3+-hydroxamate transport system substrate-binding protein
VEVKIGVTHANRELILETSQSVDDVQKAISDALSSDNGVVTFTDDKGRTVVIPAEKVAYVEISGEAGRRVGFGAA